MNVTNSYQIKLKDGQTLFLERVLDKNADFTQDQDLGVTAFISAYNDTPHEHVHEHFKGAEKIGEYYRNLIDEYDIQPFRSGKLIWIRAYLESKFVGWMGLEANFIEKNNTYISTFVLDPSYEGKGIGEKMISSIVDHWLTETSELNLIVRKINHKALGFYQRLGFTSAEDINHPYLDNSLHCMFMRYRVRLEV